MTDLKTRKEEWLSELEPSPISQRLNVALSQREQRELQAARLIRLYEEEKEAVFHYACASTQRNLSTLFTARSNLNAAWAEILGEETE